MELHILDLLMFLIIAYIILKILGDEYTTEIGGIVGMIVFIVYIIVYTIYFVLLDNNWIDIFKYLFSDIKL